MLQMMALSIITINVNGLQDAVKRAGVVQWLQALLSPVDICVCKRSTARRLRSALGGFPPLASFV